jgi:small conductance mechanosensitive channel
MVDIWFNELRAIMGPWLDPSTLEGAIAYGVVIFGSAGLLSWLLGSLIRHWEHHFRRIFKGVDETIWRFTIHLKSLVVFLIALVVYAFIVPSLKGILTTLAAGAGLTAVIIGFAAKSSLSNLISGIALAVFRPIRIGDTVTIENEYGIIEDITIRHTVLLTWEHKRIIFPNEKIDNSTIVNYSLTDPRMLLRLELGVSYDTDIDLARRLILDEMMKCPHRLDESRALAEPRVRVIDHGDFAIKLRALMWTATIDECWQARFWLLEHIKKRFDTEGVEIPFPYRTVVYKSDLPPARREDPASGPAELDQAADQSKALVVVPQPEPSTENDSINVSGFNKFWRFWRKPKKPNG